MEHEKAKLDRNLIETIIGENYPNQKGHKFPVRSKVTSEI
jgi:hypothetical protein